MFGRKVEVPKRQDTVNTLSEHLPCVKLQLCQLLPQIILGHAVDVSVSHSDLFVHRMAKITVGLSGGNLRIRIFRMTNVVAGLFLKGQQTKCRLRLLIFLQGKIRRNERSSQRAQASFPHIVTFTQN